MHERTKEFVTLPIDEIVPYENNPRNNDEAVEDVVESIKQLETETLFMRWLYNRQSKRK